MNLSLEARVAQLFIVGSDSPEMLDELEPFTQTGLGGLILFRHHLQRFETAEDVQHWLFSVRQQLQKGAGLSFISIDQEGGQVERLPHWTFPSGILPVTLSQQSSTQLTQATAQDMASRLHAMGFNCNYTPCADVQREPQNPIIGVRAYGYTAQQVSKHLAPIINAYHQHNMLSVIKHFPGHGAGTVDSHLALPVFEHWHPDELIPFDVGIRDCNVPAVMVAHGLYPQLSRRLGADKSVPASLSSVIIQQLLRQQLGFNGLVMSDDLMMNAVYEYAEPEEVALKALMAGVDMVIYRRAQPEALQAYQYVLQQLKHGKLSEQWLNEKVERILAARHQFPLVQPEPLPQNRFSPQACDEQALYWAQQAWHEYHHDFISPLPITAKTPWILIAPDTQTMVHYAPDSLRGKNLSDWLVHYGIPPQYTVHYACDHSAQTPSLPPNLSHASVIVFIAFNSHLHAVQRALYEQLKQQYPQAKFIVASAGMPLDADVLSRPWVHVQLPSYRPAAQQALAQWLLSSPSNTA